MGRVCRKILNGTCLLKNFEGRVCRKTSRLRESRYLLAVKKEIMPLNKNALIRYRTIDKCLQNRYKKWTLKDLIQSCSDALYEYEGKTVNVSRRTVQLDIQMMRSDKLGYNAPIVVYDVKYYKYEDEEYRITDIPLTEMDMDVLTESVEMLKQFKDFSLFSELNGVIQKLEDKVYREKNQQSAIIHMDKNEHLKGLNFLDILYQSILKKLVLKITYQSFSARKSSLFSFHAYILKEYNNRWFVIGRKDGEEKILTLALDRIIKLNYDLKLDYQQTNFDADKYYENTYGVTVLTDRQLINVELKVDRYNAPYVITKPFHHSQQTIETFENGSVTIKLRLHHNFELERLILGFAESIEVLKPKKLRNAIQYKLRKAYQLYESK